MEELSTKDSRKKLRYEGLCHNQEKLSNNKSKKRKDINEKIQKKYIKENNESHRTGECNGGFSMNQKFWVGLYLQNKDNQQNINHQTYVDKRWKCVDF